MEIKQITQNGIAVAVVNSEELVITDLSSALSFLFSIREETGCDRIALNKEAVTEDFFRLSTCLAGEILQKFINYHMKFALYGDYSHYTSKPLRDFLYESNNGNDIFFPSTQDEAVEKLSRARSF